MVFSRVHLGDGPKVTILGVEIINVMTNCKQLVRYIPRNPPHSNEAEQQSDVNTIVAEWGPFHGF